MLNSKNRDRLHRKHQEAIKAEINQAYRNFFHTRQLNECGFEDISGMTGKTKYKGLSRRVSLWTRGYLRERLDFLSDLFGVKVTYVNPAYTSQECPVCYYVNSKNRNRDAFKCLSCGHQGHADHVAAVNIKGRMNDNEISLTMKKSVIKEVLKNRHEEMNLTLG